MIPKRIIYTWFGNKQIPEDFLKFKKTWEKYNPDFEILEINENNFDVNSFNFTKQAYDSGKMAFVSDVARIWAINHYGGIYLDTDVEVLKSLKNLLTYRQFWAKEDAGFVATGLAFGSVKDDPVLKEILDAYSNLEFTSNNLEELSTVHIISNILRKYGLKDNRETNILNNKGIVFAPEFFAPYHYWGGGKVTKKTITIHHYSDQPSWTNKSNSAFNFIVHEIMYWIPVLGRCLRWIKKKFR